MKDIKTKNGESHHKSNDEKYSSISCEKKIMEEKYNWIILWVMVPKKQIWTLEAMILSHLTKMNH